MTNEVPSEERWSDNILEEHRTSSLLKNRLEKQKQKELQNILLSRPRIYRRPRRVSIEFEHTILRTRK